MADQIKSDSGLILDHLLLLQDRIDRSCARAGRPPASVRCVAVSKGHPAGAVRAAVSAGLADIGENRVQEALDKAPHLSDIAIRWHLVGTLQSNKVRPAVRTFSMIHSLDRPELAAAIQKESERIGRTVDVLIQVEPTGEPAKHGVKPDAALAMAESLGRLPNIRLRGFMAIGPLPVSPTPADTAPARACFKTVRELFDQFRKSGRAAEEFDTLSMGMSDDFEIAIEEGATLIRVGTILFGPRPVRV